MKHLCIPREQPARLPCPPPFILPLLPELGWVSPAHGSRGDTATPRYRNGWVLPSHPPCASPTHEAPLTSPLPRPGKPAHRGCPSRVCPVSPPPPRVGLPAAKRPLSIRRQARDYRSRLFEAETNRKSFSQLPFGDVNTAGRGSAGSAVPGGAVGCKHTDTLTLTRTLTLTHAHSRGSRGCGGPPFLPFLPFPAALRGNRARKGCECECECPALGRSLAPGLGLTIAARGCGLRVTPSFQKHPPADDTGDIQPVHS